MTHCPDCAAITVNGTLCHEINCPSEHIDLLTGRGKLVPCFDCGRNFRAGNRADYRCRYRVCADCIAAALGDVYDNDVYANDEEETQPL